MADLLMFIFGSVGMTLIITRGDIFKAFRDWVYLRSVFFGEAVQCVQCVGFWSGLFCGAIIYPVSPRLFVLACAGSLATICFNLILTHFNSNKE